MRREERDHGAGFASGRANAIARLCAGILNQDAEAVRDAMHEIDEQHRRGNSPSSGRNVHGRVSRALAEHFPPSRVRRAMAVPPGHAGDVQVEDVQGATMRIEIKAQLEKAAVGDLTQADWVRDATDALRYLNAHDAEFSKRLSVANRQYLMVDKDYFGSWGFTDLWLADLVGLTSREARLKYELSSPADIREFIRHKYLLHLCQERDALLAIGELSALADILARDGKADYTLKQNAKSECAVPVSVGRGPTIFTYHIYPPGYSAGVPFLGRHKLHARAIA